MSNNPKNQKINISLLEVDEDDNQRNNKSRKTTRKIRSENDNTDEAEPEVESETDEPSLPIEPAPEVPLDNLKDIKNTAIQEAASIASARFSKRSRIQPSGLSSKIIDHSNFHPKI